VTALEESVYLVRIPDKRAVNVTVALLAVALTGEERSELNAVANAEAIVIGTLPPP
jgi:hypothetical protein